VNTPCVGCVENPQTRASFSQKWTVRSKLKFRTCLEKYGWQYNMPRQSPQLAGKRVFGHRVPTHARDACCHENTTTYSVCLRGVLKMEISFHSQPIRCQFLIIYEANDAQLRVCIRFGTIIVEGFYEAGRLSSCTGGYAQQCLRCHSVCQRGVLKVEISFHSQQFGRPFLIIYETNDAQLRL
jgi:NAD-dependent dihydropyrimidine dehydrogenase PreA subunit